jgi:hypothetical protein
MCTLLKSCPSKVELTIQEYLSKDYRFNFNDEERSGYYKSESGFLFMFEDESWWILDGESFTNYWIKVTSPNHAQKVEKWYNQGIADLLVKDKQDM